MRGAGLITYVLVNDNITESELNKIMQSILLQSSDKNIKLKPILDKQLYNNSVPIRSTVLLSNTSEYVKNPTANNGYHRKDVQYLYQRYDIDYYNILSNEQIKSLIQRRKLRR